MQFQADVLGVPFQRLQRSEFGTWGSAMVAGKAVGIYEDLAEVAARHAQPEGEPIYPDEARHAAYAPLVRQYIEMQAQLRDGFVRGAAQS